ncbi:MAG: 3-dehydroquinate synthase [Desulfotomaculum sp.]|nr:3-dehydroquinate synthase [Desulfotomaculum sp.]
MTTVLSVNLAATGQSRTAKYDIVIGTDLLPQTGAFLQPLNLGHKVLVITNSAVRKLHGKAVEESLRQSGYKVQVAEVPDSEEAKTPDQATKLYDVMFNAGMDRNSPVLALGGGVVGDLSGFVAATYMRGVPFVQIPTTLLAQVDSSVGGKVAVNHPQGKNIIGAFYQPKLVLTDTGTLNTLDQRDVLSGLAEVIKVAIIKDAVFFEWLENNTSRVLALEPAALKYVIETSCRIKALVVEADETEQGVRAILNYGHTVGHALETLAGYGAYRHGEAVAVGMAVEANISQKLGLIATNIAYRVKSLLAKFGLPVALPLLDAQELISLMYKDKKVFNDTLTLALINNIGQAIIKQDVPEEIILQAIEEIKDKR